MKYQIEEIEGIGHVYGDRLQKLGIKSTDDLLAKGAKKSGRQDIAAKSGIPESLILTWVNHADLMRINGVGGQFAELLEASGVDSVKEFALRNAANLHTKMMEVNQKMGLSGKVPSTDGLQDMIDAAKKLEQKVFH